MRVTKRLSTVQLAWCVALAVVLTSGCGSGGSAMPSGPSGPQVSGVWVGEQTLTTFSGADCLEPVFTDLVGFPSQFHATFTQSAQKIEATLDIVRTGSTCTYSGTLDGDALELTSVDCTAPRTIGLRCSTGALRDLVPAHQTLHATVSGDRITGIAIENDTVTTSVVPITISSFSGQSSFILTRQ